MNCALALSKIGGANVLPVVRVGADPQAELLRDCLEANGIASADSRQGIIVDENMRTVVVICLVNTSRDMERSFVHLVPNKHDHQDTGTPKIEDLAARLQILKSSSACHFTCVGYFEALSRPEISEFMQELKSGSSDLHPTNHQRPIVTADTLPADTPLQDGLWRKSIKGFLRHVDYFLPSDLEAQMMTDTAPGAYRDAARKLQDEFEIPTVCVKVHERGAFCLDSDGAEYEVDAFPLLKVTDTTGAGDAWCAGFLAATAVHGYDLATACSFGNAAAHYSIREIGATTNIPNWEELWNLVNSHCNLLGVQPKGNSRDVFLSYSTHDEQFARHLRENLESRVLSVWLDSNELEAGDLSSQLNEGLLGAKTCVIVLSKSSMRSDWVEHELNVAIQKEKATGADVLFPISLDSSLEPLQNRPPWSLLRHRKHIVDFGGWQDQAEFAVQLERLVKGLEKAIRPRR